MSVITKNSKHMFSQEIVPHVYQLSIRAVNIFLIIEDELTLIDTGFGDSSAKIASFIHRLGRSVEEVSLIIITHNHFDHVGGLAELKKLTNARVAAHQAGIAGAEEEPPYIRGVRRLLLIPPFSALRRHLTLEPDEVDIQLKGGEVLEPLGGLQVVHTPGHTSDSISLYSSRNKLLIVGDALVKRRKMILLPYRMVSSNLKQAVDSVKKMAQLDVDTVCFGHGRPITEGTAAKLAALVRRDGAS